MTTDAILAMAEAEIARKKYEEMDQQLVAILEERAKAEERLTEAKEEQAEAQADYNEAYDAYLEHLNDAPGVVSEYRDALNNANEDLQDAKEYTNDCEDAYNSLNSEAEDLAGQMGELSSAEKKATDAVEDNADALDEQAQAAKEATQSVAKIALKAQEATQSGNDLGDTYDDLRKELDDLKGSGDPYIESLAEQALKQLEVAATAEELQTNYSSLTDSLGVSAGLIASALVGAGMSADEFASGCESMKERVINSFEEIKVNEEMTASQIAGNLANNLAVHEQWSGNLIDLWNNTEDETVRAFILYLYDQGPELATAVDQFAHGGTEELLSAAESWAAIGDSTAQGYLARVAGQAELAGAYGTQLSDGALSGVNTEPFGAKGTEAGQVFASNITAQAPAVQAAATSLAMTAHSAMSQVGWAELGGAIGTGISGGITGQTATVQTAAQTWPIRSTPHGQAMPASFSSPALPQAHNSKLDCCVSNPASGPPRSRWPARSPQHGANRRRVSVLRARQPHLPLPWASPPAAAAFRRRPPLRRTPPMGPFRGFPGTAWATTFPPGSPTASGAAAISSPERHGRRLLRPSVRRNPPWGYTPPPGCSGTRSAR